jgi:hypothetical protein
MVNWLCSHHHSDNLNKHLNIVLDIILATKWVHQAIFIIAPGNSGAKLPDQYNIPKQL